MTRIRELRRAKGLTMAGLSAFLGISPQEAFDDDGLTMYSVRPPKKPSRAWTAEKEIVDLFPPLHHQPLHYQSLFCSETHNKRRGTASAIHANTLH